MRFLADESCDFRVVRALRAVGHDVIAASEVTPGADDATIIDMAVREQRIFLTEDRDFGQLVYAAAKPTAGVILLRFPSSVRAGLPALVVDVVAKYGERLASRFIVLEPGRVRFGGNPRRRQ
jgi:predicted nuclease of predicted toxin-antitoxin system